MKATIASVFAFGITLLLSAGPAHAALVTLEAGESVIFNFDLTAATPPPPYDSLDFGVEAGGLGLNGLELSAFSELGAQGTNVVSGSEFDVLTVGFPNQPGLTDGLFSVVITAGAAGTLEIFEFTAAGIAGTQITSPVLPTVVAVAVPEPATLSLTVLGLSGLWHTRRRRRLAARSSALSL